jgi:prephenate dehydrogenase
MAGTAESGIEAAQSGLFAGNPYVLTPVAATPPDAVQVVEEVVRSLPNGFIFVAQKTTLERWHGFHICDYGKC